MKRIIYLIICFSLFFLGAPEFSSLEAVPHKAIATPLKKNKREKLFKKFLIPKNHPLKPTLDALFTLRRPTLDINTLQEAGFGIIARQPRSFIVVADHPLLPGVLLKLYTDNELRIKKGVQGIDWFIYRCIGAKRIRRAIKSEKIKTVVVPRKWLYKLPSKDLVPNDGNYVAKPALLVVERMNLVSEEENKYLWKTAITEQHLVDLYTIIVSCSSVLPRPDNIHWTIEGKLAIIDTEYPKRKPVLSTIRHYLNPEMKKVWDDLRLAFE